MVDAILEVTHFEDLTFVALSQGTTLMFSALAENHGDLNSKVNLFIALGPIVRLDHIQNKQFEDYGKDIDNTLYWLSWFGINEILGPKWQKWTYENCPTAPDSWKDICYSSDMLDIQRRNYWDDAVVPLEDQL